MIRNSIAFRDRLERLKGSPVELDLAPYDVPLAEIRALGEELGSLADEELGARSRALAEEVRSGGGGEALRCRAFALVREAAHRTLGLRAYDEQVLAALALDEGKVVEVETGEGKTLAAVFPAYLQALAGRSVHVLTANDYLARRDAEWMGPAYRLLGLTAGWVAEDLDRDARRRAYTAEVTYATAKEAGFDFLRDLLALEDGELVHRPFCSAIVDEADSLMIDEARVPLVIAGEVEGGSSRAGRLAHLVEGLEPGVDYETDEYGRNVALTEAGYDRVEGELGRGDLLAEENYLLLTELNCALHARALLHRDADYIVRDGRVEVVDENTGRVVEDRHWPDGLQAALEAKEGLENRAGGRILGSISLQHFLLSYPRLAGMTGTARDGARELSEVYRLPVVVVPTHRPRIRLDHPDRVFTHREAKERAVVEEVRSAHAVGRPVLVGTLTVAESERLGSRLRAEGLACEVLNAKNDAREAEIVARAGAPGAITISTNMAGRGTDIRLGGPSEEERERVVAAGGLYVIGTNRHESRRIDLQLRGRAGRQGDPGESRFFVSLEDELMRRYGLARLVPERFWPERQAGALENPVVAREIARAQRIIEGQNREIRKTLERYAEPIEEQRRRIHRRRRELLLGECRSELWRRLERYPELAAVVGEEALKGAERLVTLFHTDRLWSEHLGYAADLREGIHLVGLGGTDPLTHFKLETAKAYHRLLEEIDRAVEEAFEEVRLGDGGLDLANLGLRGPSSTWTYLIDDNPFRDQLALQLTGPGKTTAGIGAAIFALPLLVLWGLVDRFFKKRKR